MANTYPVQIKKGSTVVMIDAVKVEEDLLNAPIEINMPVMGTEKPNTHMVDLKRLKHTFSIQGYLPAQTIGGNAKTATETKNILITDILYPEGKVELKWRTNVEHDYDTTGSTTYLEVFFRKVKFQDIALRAEGVAASADSTASFPDSASWGSPNRYALEILFVRGKE